MIIDPPFPSAAASPPGFGIAAATTNTEPELDNLEIARRYFAAIETATSGEPADASGTVESFFAPDVIQEEFPNRVVPGGARRDLAALREAGARGRAVLRGQRYEVRAAYAVGETVILEVLWVGTLAIAVGTVPAGGEMRAHFAVFLEFRDGRIYRQQLRLLRAILSWRFRRRGLARDRCVGHHRVHAPTHRRAARSAGHQPRRTAARRRRHTASPS